MEAVVKWLFNTADAGGDFAERAKQERDSLHAVYKECYGSKGNVDHSSRRNFGVTHTYASQCFLICKKIVQCG